MTESAQQQISNPLSAAAQKHDAEVDKKMRAIRDRQIEDRAKQAALAAKLPYVDLHTFPVDNAALFLMEEGDARTGQVAIITQNGSQLAVAVTDPENAQTKVILEKLRSAKYTIRLVIASSLALETVFERYKYRKKEEVVGHGVLTISEKDFDELQANIKNLGDLRGRISSIPLTQVLDVLIAGGLNVGASDIHFEPEEHTVRLRYRMDGVLTEVVTLDPKGYHEILSRIKLNSGLKINVHNSPQDGRFTIRQKSKDIEVRVSVLPGAYGENVVMRLLDPDSIRQKLEDLGMREDTLTLCKKMLAKTTGAIFTTGPTGSGKTTTLYAFIQSINSPDTKVITIEDPVEYHIQGISQTQVHEAAGYTFADGLRSIVRQDPDVILVGEIRDRETAEIAMQASLTGHLVLSTIHTNSAAGTIPRLIDLGVKPVSIAPALNAAMAQRLVRRLCIKCRKKEKIHLEDLAVFKKYLSNAPKVLAVPALTDSLETYYPAECTVCNNTGYKGRIGAYEIFEVDDEMEKVVMRSPGISEIQDLAVQKGMITMMQDALIKVLNGITTTEEVLKVIGE